MLNVKCRELSMAMFNGYMLVITRGYFFVKNGALASEEYVSYLHGPWMAMGLVHWLVTGLYSRNIQATLWKFSIAIEIAHL